MSLNCSVSQFLLSIAVCCSMLHVTAGVPMFTVRPQSVTVAEGETVRLSCAATGTPPPVLTWTFGSKQLQPKSDGTLVIQVVTMSDEGKYECAASNVNGHTETSATVTVTVRHKPYFTSAPQNTTAAAGSTVKLPCTAIGTPTPSTSWNKINESLPSGYSIEQDYLMLPNVSKLASGVFQCTSVNTHGTVSVTATLLILDPIKFERTPRNHNGDIGGTALMECSIDPSGTPGEISWLKDDIQIDPSKTSRYSIISGGSLLISGLQREDMARYTCKAEGAVGVMTASAIILLPGAKRPEFNTFPTNAPILPGETIKLDCTASGVPDPQVTWTKNGQSLGTVADNRYTVVGTRLVILSAVSRDTGNFTCTAANIVGTATMSVVLTVGVPALTTATAPQHTETTKKTEKDSDLIFIVALAAGITGGVVVIIIIIIVCCCCCCGCCQSRDADIENVLEAKTSFPSWQNGGAVDLNKMPPSSFTNPTYENKLQAHDPTNQLLQQRLHRMGMQMQNDEFQHALAPNWNSNERHEQNEETEESETDDSESGTEETESSPDIRRGHSKQSKTVAALRESNKHLDDYRRSTEHRRGSSQYQEDRRRSLEHRDDRRSSVTRQDGRRGSVQRREDPRPSYKQRDKRKTSQESRGDRRGSFQHTDDRRGSTQRHSSGDLRRYSTDNPQAMVRKSSDQSRRHSTEHERKRSAEYEKGGQRRNSSRRLSYDEDNKRDRGGRRHSRSSATDRRQRDYDDQMLY